MNKPSCMMLSCLAILTMAACSKNGSNTNNNVTPDPMVSLTTYEKEVVGKWVFEKSVDSDFTLQNQFIRANGYTYPCKQDDVYTFRTDKKYTKAEGADTCGSELYRDETWSIDTGRTFRYSHSPAPYAYNNAKYYKIDDTHFMTQAKITGANNISKLTYFYKKFQ